LILPSANKYREHGLNGLSGFKLILPSANKYREHGLNGLSGFKLILPSANKYREHGLNRFKRIFYFSKDLRRSQNFNSYQSVAADGLASVGRINKFI
jgi:hypothetical protein